ncbi:hypothetical protein JTB14_000637 [Gonioctena quinquepunctata]|nr:hypothetical protein JTB14_000637 [Gonioctena quinquepunctata]
MVRILTARNDSTTSNAVFTEKTQKFTRNPGTRVSPTTVTQLMLAIRKTAAFRGRNKWNDKRRTPDGKQHARRRRKMIAKRDVDSVEQQPVGQPGKTSFGQVGK